jgi:hypothetical protein
MISSKSAPALKTTPAQTRADVAEHGLSPDWKTLLQADLRRQAVRRPWGSVLMALGWVHLGFFVVSQAVFTVGVRAPICSLALWAAELAAVLWTVRRVAGPGWFRESPTIGLIVRVWVTFLILSFNVSSLNSLMGWSIDWFKPVWCTLSSFGFATMAWLFGYRLLIPAFQMYFTGLLMVQFPEWSYLIYGVSWCATLQYLGFDLRKHRARLMSHPTESIGVESRA